jgi:serine/threonine protein kinase
MVNLFSMLRYSFYFNINMNLQWFVLLCLLIQVEQLHKIFKLCGSPSEDFWANLKLSRATIFKPQHPYRRCVNDVYKDFPTTALTLLDYLLAVEPGNRGTAASALDSEVSTGPYIC